MPYRLFNSLSRPWLTLRPLCVRYVALCLSTASTVCPQSFPQQDLQYLLFPTFVVFLANALLSPGFHENLTFHVFNMLSMFFLITSQLLEYEQFTNTGRGEEERSLLFDRSKFHLPATYNKLAHRLERQHTRLGSPSSLLDACWELNRCRLAARHPL